MKNHNQTTLQKLTDLINELLIPFDMQSLGSYQNLLKKIGDSRVVLMGEATHGTKEFYQIRMQLSEALIKEKGFQAIAIEGDWTSVAGLQDYIDGNISSLAEAMQGFERFPQWMWGNQEMANFLKRLREYNAQQKYEAKKVKLFGLDLYSLHSSIHAVIDYFKTHFPHYAEQVEKRYACFDHNSFDPQAYGYLVEHNLKSACVKEVTEQLLETHRLTYQKIAERGPQLTDAFYALQNARVVKNAEYYYRAMYESRHETWNIRDHHMIETLENVMSHLENLYHMPAKVIVWAHNSHIGDARATEMHERQEVNLGQLARERFDGSTFLLGFSTAIGCVTAADNWDSPHQFKKIQIPMEGSYEHLFHHTEEKNFLLDLREENHLTQLLKMPRLQRAIGVVYHPHTERHSHYYFARLPYQFDCLIHLDKTHSLKPLKNRQLKAQKNNSAY